MAQQNPNPQPADAGRIKGKSRRDRPFTIESRWNLIWMREPDKWTEWRVSGRYRTEAERDAALENLQRKYTGAFEYRKGGDQ